MTEAGVYWFGVHALGNTDAARDGVADGRARTFLPLVPAAEARPPLPTALVLPLRRPVHHAPDGRPLVADHADRLVVTSDKDGPNSALERELADKTSRWRLTGV